MDQLNKKKIEQKNHYVAYDRQIKGGFDVDYLA